MNNNFYNIPKDWYKEFNDTFMNANDMSINDMMNMGMNTNNMNIMGMNNANLADPKEGFLRGNLFDNLYDPYKNYKYRDLRPSNKREELLFELMKYKFAMKELNLYLDTHPNDTKMISLYNKYLKEEKMVCDEYERNYGPLTLDSMYLDDNLWKWNNSPWPWEGTR